MNELIVNNPRGLALTYAVRVRGLPYLFTDGRATWQSFDGSTVLASTLADQDFGFTANAEARDPTDVGTGMRIQLVDTHAGELRRLFAPQYVGDTNTRLTADFEVASGSNLMVKDTTGIAVNDVLYIGLETVQVNTVVSGTELAVARDLYLSEQFSHRMQITEQGALGPRCTASPRIFRGRYIEVFVAGILPDGSADEYYTWWSGRLASTKLHSRAVMLECDPLNAVIEEDEWPYVTASAKLPSDGLQFSLPRASAVVRLQLGIRYSDINIGYYNSSNVFTDLPVNTTYNMTELFTALSHTIQKAMLDTGLASANGARNKFSIGWDYFTFEQATGTRVRAARYSNRTTMDVRLVDDTGFGAMLKTIAIDRPFRWNPRFFAEDGDEWATFALDLAVLTPEATNLRLVLDTRWRPFTMTGYDNMLAAPIGYAKISDGTAFEVISYTGVTLDPDGKTLELSGVTRGVARTDALTWPRPDDNGELRADADTSQVRVEQLFAASFNENTFIWRILNAMMVSRSPYSVQLNGPFDYFGEFGGLGIPQDFVWYEDIQAKLNRQYLPKAFMFFVSEPGKGKAEFKEWLKLFGIYLVPRRFQREGVWRYGLTVDIIDSTRLTQYNEAATDADRKAGSEPTLDIDQHIVINQVSYRPIYRFGEDASSANVGGMRYVYSEESITDYGAAKMLELKASAMFLGSQGYGGQYVTAAEDLQIGIATETALRWFGVYDHGVNFLEFESPHIGWRLQPGDQVLLSMTGVPSPFGDKNLSSSVGKVVRAQYRTGTNAGATIRMMLTNTNAVDWAPSARINDVGGGTNLTLAQNDFTDIDATTAAIYGDPIPDADGRFFRPTAYHPTLALPVVVYDAQDYAGTAVNTTVTVYTNALSLTVGNSLSSLSAAAAAGRLFMTLRGHNQLASARYNAHTYVNADKEMS